MRVHHTNEVAQSECALGVHPWVGTWVHTEFLDLGGAKISKSTGDVLLVDSLVERGIDPLAFRYFTLQTHYRQQQAFTFEAVEAAGTALRRLIGHAVAARDAGGEVADPAEVEPVPAPVLGRPGRRPQLAAGPGRRLGGRPGHDALAPADKWAVLADADRALGFGLAEAVAPLAATTPARTRASTRWWPSARRPGRPGLRHRRPHPRRAGRRGHRARRHRRRPQLAPPVAAPPATCGSS